MKVAQSCLTLFDPMNCSSSVHGILQAKNIGVGYHFPPLGALPDPRIKPGTRVFGITDRFFTTEPPGKPRSSTVYVILLYMIFDVKIKTVSLFKESAMHLDNIF